MKIYTGYFAQLKRYRIRGLIPVGIARKSPDFFIDSGWKSYPPLFPSEGLLRDWKSGKIQTPGYIWRYVQENLDGLDHNKVVEDLLQIGQGKDVILLCWEKSSDFCHRHIVKEWLNQNNIFCEEFPVKSGR